MERPDTRDQLDRLLLGSLYLLECAAIVLVLGLNKLGGRPLVPFLATHAGFAFAGALVTSVGCVGMIIRQIGRARTSHRIVLTVGLNLVSVVVTTVVAETALRLLTVQTATGQEFAGTQLLPYSWETIAAHQYEVWRGSLRGPSGTPLLVYDDSLGWTVGRSRQSSDGLYSSSAEGIRSADRDVAHTGRQPRYRLAIVGDSFAFANEVSYADSWGYRLERQLGLDVEVLNFGVAGYGVDQSYLRYMRDVRPRRPDVVIFGLIDHDMERTMAVYPFVGIPEWDLPFAKPRFVVTPSGLTVLNLPLVSPDAIFTRRAIAELPYVEYDRGYSASAWEWHWYHDWFVARFLLSRFPRWPARGPLVSDDAKRAVNQKLLTSMTSTARGAGSVPIVVYFPTRSDFVPPEKRFEGWGFARHVLDEAGIAYVDLTPCVAALSPSARWLQIHYSPLANAAVAQCLRQPVLERLVATRRP